MAKRKIMELIVYIIMIIFLAVFFYGLIGRILGHSLQAESLIIAILTIMMGFIISMVSLIISNSKKISSIGGEFKHFKRSFGALASDFKEFKTNQEKFNNWSRVQFQGIKNEFRGIRKELSGIKKELSKA